MDIRRTNLPKVVKDLIDEDELKQAVLAAAEEQVPGIVAKEFKDSSYVATVQDYPGIEPKGYQMDEYLLVLEFLQSIGLTYAPSVLRYESMHPEVSVSRKELAERLDLKASGHTPLLVQLFQERLDEISEAEKYNKQQNK